MAKDNKETNLMQKIESLAKRRGFIFPGSEIYGGLQNSWDYGPLGAELKKNIKDEWWRRFVRGRPDMVGIDAALIMNPKVWEASGHFKNFTDPIVECGKCHARFREDQAPEEITLLVHNKNDKKHEAISVTWWEGSACPNCKAKDSWILPGKFNLMLKTFLGPAEEKANEVYLRPETAQAMFVQFENILGTTRKRLPFGIAQMGKAFRNEITPGNFIFRTREFEQMEIEYFVREKEWEKWFDYWLNEMKQWLKDLGAKDKRLHFEEIGEEDRAFYSKRTIDIEYDYPFGKKELYGLAYRTDYDLKQHAKASSGDLSYLDPETNEKIIPHVIEPTWGVDRTILVAMLEAYTEEEAPTAEEGETDKRVVMKFPYWLAPVKVAVLPLSKKEELQKIARPIYEDLLKDFVCEYDETQSIGKRYRRQDEIGTPFCVTVDFDSVSDKSVTVRERDSMKQERVKMSELITYLFEQLAR